MASPSSSIGSPASISFQEYLQVSALVFEWADSYDTKDWDRLRRIIAPTLRVDYSKIGKGVWEQMTAKDFMAMVADEDFLGDVCVRTQHLLGATRWERVSDTLIVGRHQLRAAHQVYSGPDRQTVVRRGHSHATNEHYYARVDGVWKFAGLAPTVHWNEHEFEKVFKGSFKSQGGN